MRLAAPLMLALLLFVSAPLAGEEAPSDSPAAGDATADRSVGIVGGSEGEFHRIVTLAPGGPLLGSPILSRLSYYRAVHQIAEGRWKDARENLAGTVVGDPSLVRAHLLLSAVRLHDLDPKWILSLLRATSALRGNFRAQSLLAANVVIYAEIILVLLLVTGSAVSVLRAVPALRHAFLESLPARFPRAVRPLYGAAFLAAIVLLFRPWAWLAGVVWLTVAGLLFTWKALGRGAKGTAAAFLLAIPLGPVLIKLAVAATLPATPGTTLFALAETPLAPFGEERAATLLAREPNDRDVLFSLALLERERGNREKAMGIYREMLGEGHESAAVYNNMGNLLFLEGEVDQAFAAYRRANDLDPDRATVHYNLGQLYLQVFSFDQAREQFARASEIDFSLIRNLSHAGETTRQHTLVDESIPAKRLWGRLLSGKTVEGMTWREAAAAERRILFPYPPARALPLVALLAFAFWYGRGRPAATTCARCGRALCRRCRIRSGRKNLCPSCRPTRGGPAWNRNTLLYHRPMSLTLSLLLPGAGHIYLGRLRRGFLYVALSFLLVAVWVFRGPILKPFPILSTADLAPLENLAFAWLFTPLYLFVLFDTVFLIRRSFPDADGERSG